jgi:hypothetical protein
MALAVTADLIVVLHFTFILFVVLGGLLVLRWPRLAWVHLPSVLWGTLIELSGLLICPLTPLEHLLRRAAGGVDYEGGFIDHYLVPLIYPPGLTREIQIVLGILVLVINAFAYGVLIRRRYRSISNGS